MSALRFVQFLEKGPPEQNCKLPSGEGRWRLWEREARLGRGQREEEGGARRGPEDAGEGEGRGIGRSNRSSII